METRVALIGILVSDRESAARLNEILQEYGDYIVGRMGIPYQKRKVSVISLVLLAAAPAVLFLIPLLRANKHASRTR